MKLLKCKLCLGEIDIIGSNDRSVHKKIKCQKCNFTNVNDYKKKEPEVFIRKKPIWMDDE